MEKTLLCAAFTIVEPADVSSEPEPLSELEPPAVVPEFSFDPEPPADDPEFPLDPEPPPASELAPDPEPPESPP